MSTKSWTRIALVGTLCAAAAAAACGDSGGNGDAGNGDGDGGGNGDGDGGNGTCEFCDAAIAENCKKVDVIIAVDNSSSMSEEKQALADDVFPAFANALLNVGGGLEDYRVGVLDACPDPANYHTSGVGGACNFASGQVWMHSSDPMLAQEFQCVGNVDSSDMLCSGDSDDEQPASAAATSMEEPWLSGANAGFLRNDALLVVVAITDEDEQPIPSMSAQGVHDRLVAAKGGDVRRMVFLGIAGASDCTGVYGTANQANRMIELSNLFIAEERGVFWDLCVGRLEDGLTQAMQVIEQACNEFPPIP
jgi:hypothetical protein